MPVYRLVEDLSFPPPHLAEEGLLAVGGDLRPERLLLAYREGIFPWYSEGEPLLWWSPDPRMVIFPGQLHVSRRLARFLRNCPFDVSMDTAFHEVVAGCAQAPRPGQEGTWITSEMAAAYSRLHDMGYAHSVECRRQGRLVGGIYGISLGRCFFGESMFSAEPNASKVALCALMAQIEHWGFRLMDCQVANPHLWRLGACEIPRRAFLKLLREFATGHTRRGKWSFERAAAVSMGIQDPDSESATRGFGAGP